MILVFGTPVLELWVDPPTQYPVPTVLLQQLCVKLSGEIGQLGTRARGNDSADPVKYVNRLLGGNKDLCLQWTCGELN